MIQLYLQNNRLTRIPSKIDEPKAKVRRSFTEINKKELSKEELSNINRITLNDNKIYKYLLKTYHGNTRKSNSKKDLSFVDPNNFLATVNDVIEDIVNRAFDIWNPFSGR